AFIAGALLADLTFDKSDTTHASDDEDMADDADLGANRGAEGDAVEPAEEPKSPADREALVERAVVVNDEAAWRRWVLHEQSLILIPGFDEANVDAAIRRGHHVLLPRVARPGDSALAPLHRGQARLVWERAGVPFPQDDDLARASGRSLTSLRRRIGRAGRFRKPAWAEGASANVLAP